MAQLEIGSLNPINISDSVLNQYKQRVQSGENVDMVIKDFATSLENQVRQAGDIGSSTGEDFIKSLGFTKGGQFSQFLSAKESGTGAYNALKAYFTNTEAPTLYTPGSLQPGQTPQVVQGTTKPTPTQSQQQRQPNNIPVNDPNDPAQLAYNQRLAQMGGQQIQTPTSTPSISSQSYTVQTGDTLSKIASRLGVSVQDISGFKSGNPNLIYPGESLTIKKLSGNAPASGGFSMQQIQQQASLSPQQNLQIEQTKSIPGNIKDSLVSKGISADDASLSNLAQVSPTKFVTDLYQQIYKNSGLSDIKTQYENFNKQINTITDEMNDKVVDVNNNPWLTEGVRAREVKKIQDKYQSRIDSATNSAKYMQTLYDSGLEEARFITQQASTAYNNEIDFQNELYLKALEHGYNMAEAETKLSGPISVGEGNTLYDPVTGKAIFTAPKSSGGGGSGGLTPSQVNSTVNSIAGAFDNEPIVKAYNTVQEGFQAIKSIGTKTSSPADDIAFIYAFAKILDPNSVVREGEYNTIQKYAQTWADNFGFSAKRIFSNSNFLTSEAKQKMLNALQPKVDSITSQYNNLQSEYQRQINDAYSGKPRQLTNYQGSTLPSNQSNNQLSNEQAYQLYLQTVGQTTPTQPQTSPATKTTAQTSNTSSLLSGLTGGYKPLSLFKLF